MSEKPYIVLGPPGRRSIYGPFADEEDAVIAWVLASGLDAMNPPRGMDTDRYRYLRYKVQWFGDSEIEALHQYPEELSPEYANVKFRRGMPRRHFDWRTRGTIDQNVQDICWLLKN